MPSAPHDTVEPAAQPNDVGATQRVQHPRIDSHAHVFRQGLPLAPGRRHAPAYDATPDDYLRLLDAHGMTHALLTAPSFLGTDNSYLIDALMAHPRRLRGTAIVSPQIDATALRTMTKMGICGIRLNLFRMEQLPDLASADYQRLFGRVRDLDGHVEIYAEGARLHALLPLITRTGAKVVVDHFGSPDPAHGLECPGFKAVLAATQIGRTWVKLSAPYRLGGSNAAIYADALLRIAGPERLLWGSDWPWTQNEQGRSFQRCLDWLVEWVPNEAAREIILGKTALEVFGFGNSASGP